MRTAALVAPFFQENTLRYVRALADLPETRAVVVTQDAPDRLPGDLRAGLAAVRRVSDCLDGEEVGRACLDAAREAGPVERLLGVLEQLQVPLAVAREAAGIPGMDVETARNFREKARMKDVLAKAGLPVARHALVEDGDDLVSFVREVGYPVVVKPPAGLGAKGTHRLRNDDELREALAALSPSTENPIEAEEFVTGEERTFEAVTIGGEPVWRSSTRYLPGPLTVIENPWIQYCVLLPREEDDPDVEAFGRTNAKALAALGMGTGLSHMEWFRRADGSHVVSEVGARPPGVFIMPMMSMTHGIDMIAAWVRLMVHDEFDPPARTHAAGTAFLRGQGRGDRVVGLRGVEQAMAEVGPIVVEARLPRPGQPKAESYEGEGHVIVRHPRTDVVEEALLRIVSLVRVDLG